MRALIARGLAGAAALAAALALAPAGSPLAETAQAAVGDCTAAPDWGTPRQDLAGRVIQLVNDHRASKGLAPLTVTAPLTDAALWKSRHMARYGYLQHADPAPPVSRTVADRLEACGYPSRTAGWGENIASGYPSPEAVVQGWLGSPGHRANIENASFRAIGVGVAATGSGRLYWTQEFGTSTTGGTTTPPPAAPVTTRLAPRSTTIFTGSPRFGSVSSLAADDGNAFGIASSNGLTAWYGRFSGASNGVAGLRVVHRGSSSATCSQTLLIWNWTRGYWRALDTRSIGTSEAETAVTVTGSLAEYVSGTSGSGDVAVGVRCSAGGASFVSSADLLGLEVTG